MMKSGSERQPSTARKASWKCLNANESDTDSTRATRGLTPFRTARRTIRLTGGCDGSIARSSVHRGPRIYGRTPGFLVLSYMGASTPVRV